jgi:hypothetical protein
LAAYSSAAWRTFSGLLLMVLIARADISAMGDPLAREAKTDRASDHWPAGLQDTKHTIYNISYAILDILL